ncbi:MAG TPA: ABC transporter substrate-binding protein [Bacillota bacterium]
MRTRLWRSAGFAGLLCLILALAACGGQGDQGTGGGGGGDVAGGDATPIRIGLVFSITGNASSLGEPERNTAELFQADYAEINGHPIEWIIEDDESDPTKAVVAVQRLIEEDQVAAVVCCTISPSSMAILDVVQQAGVPNISVAAAASIVEPVNERHWVFKTPQNDALMIDILTDHMADTGIQRVAFIGFNDAYGDSGRAEFERLAPDKGIEVVAVESYARDDTDATAQVTRMAAQNPDAFLIWAIPPGANVAHRNIHDLQLPQPIYQSHGVANRQFIELGGESVEGTLMPAGKLLVADQLPDDDPQKEVLLAYRDRYEAEYGEGTANTFGGHAWDAMAILAATIEKVLDAGADPADLPAFRTALRDELERTREFVGISGIFNYSADDHHGLDHRAATMITIQNGDWQIVR